MTAFMTTVLHLPIENEKSLLIDFYPGLRCAAVSLAWLAHAKGTLGRHDEAAEIIRQLEGLRRDGYVPAYHMALAFAGVGDPDTVFQELSRACDERDPAVLHLGVEPRFAPLRGDARFTSLLARLAFPSFSGVS